MPCSECTERARLLAASEREYVKRYFEHAESPTWARRQLVGPALERVRAAHEELNRHVSTHEAVEP